MNPRRRLLWVVSALILVIAMGVIGYMTIEDWSFLDALYMTIITMTTVGYQEVHALSNAGRIFTIILIISGVGVMLYALTTMVQYLVEGEIRDLLGSRRMKDKIAKLKDHIILCGYGQMGREVARSLQNEGVPFVIIDASQEAIARAASDGYPHVLGNATSDDILNEARIQQARGLVAAVGNDADNIFITLSAKGLHPGLFVVARACAEDADSKLKRAGADRVILPLVLAGRRLAMLAVRPLVVDFIDTAMHSRDRDLVLEDVKVGPGSPVAGTTLGEGRSQCGGAVVLAVKKKDGSLIANPPDETLLELGDELVVVGTRLQLRTLEGSA